MVLRKADILPQLLTQSLFWSHSHFSSWRLFIVDWGWNSELTQESSICPPFTFCPFIFPFDCGRQHMFLHLCLLYISIDLLIGQWSIGPFMDVSWYYLVHLAHSGYNCDGSFLQQHLFWRRSVISDWRSAAADWNIHQSWEASTVVAQLCWYDTLLASFTYSDENIHWYCVDMTPSFT